MAKTLLPKWEGKVSETLASATVDDIWPFFKDFFNFHKWFPSLTTSYGASGINGELGCIRHCSGFTIPPNGAGDGDGDQNHQVVSWSNERLIALDEDNHTLSYEIVDSNIGFNSYASTIKIDGEDGKGTVIEWTFAVDPVDGMELDDLIKKYKSGLGLMANRMEGAVRERLDRNYGV